MRSESAKGKGEGLPYYRIHHGKNRRICRNAQGKRRHCGDCEAGTLPQNAERVSDIAQAGFHSAGSLFEV
jgi:hypothetical protein